MKPNHTRRWVVLSLTLALGCAWNSLALAGVDVDFGAAVPVGDDGALFLAISSRYFDRPPELVQDWRRECRNPDDLAVALFLAGRVGHDPAAIFRLRHDGLSWWEIGARIGLPVDAWFVPVSHNPGPPYGKAYGYWRKHRHDRRATFRLTDREARDLVALRMIHEYYGVRPVEAMKWRAAHRSLPTLLGKEYRSRHPHRGGPPARGERDRRHDRQERAKSHGKSRGR